MARYLTDPVAAASAVDKGLARARVYSWDASARTLMRVYADAIARRSGSERASASEPAQE
jgi:hypothetical protein